MSEGIGKMLNKMANITTVERKAYKRQWKNLTAKQRGSSRKQFIQIIEESKKLAQETANE